jgi:hypothetical protein
MTRYVCPQTTELEAAVADSPSRGRSFSRTSPASAAPASSPHSPCVSTWDPAALTTNGAFRSTSVRQGHFVIPERMPAVLNLVSY